MQEQEQVQVQAEGYKADGGVEVFVWISGEAVGGPKLFRGSERHCLSGQDESVLTRNYLLRTTVHPVVAPSHKGRP